MWLRRAARLAVMVVVLSSVTGGFVLRSTAAEAAPDPFAAGTPLESSGSLLEGVVPARLADTRGGATADGAGPVGAVASGQVLSLDVAGRAGVPRQGAGAVVLNVTATDATEATYLTVWPTGEPVPLASNLNVDRGDTTPNLVIVKLGRDGKVNVFNQKGSVHLVIDVTGWFPEGTGLNALAPARLADTRGLGTVDNNGPIGAVTPAGATVPVTGRASVPASGVGAVVLNVTATGASAGSYLTVWPAGSAKPLASNLNFSPGDTRPNLVVTKVGPDGSVSVASGGGSVHVVVDVLGWLPVSADFTSINPARLADTRGGATVDGLGPVGMVTGGSTINVVVGGRAGLATAGVAVLNVTATDVTAPAFVTVWPAGVDRPLASNLNVGPGDTRPNLVIVPVGPDGSVNLYANSGSMNLVVDVAGLFPRPTAGGHSSAMVGENTRFAGPGDVVTTALDGLGNGTIEISRSGDVPPVNGFLVSTFDGSGAAAIVARVIAVKAHDGGTATLTVASAPLGDAVRLDDVSSINDVALPDAPGQYDGLAAASGTAGVKGIDVNGTETTGSIRVEFWDPKKWGASCSAGIDGSVNDLGIKGELRNVQHEFSLVAAAGTVGYFISGEFVVQTRVKLQSAVTCGVSVSKPVPFSIGGIPFEFKAKIGFEVTIQAGASWTDTAVYRFRSGTLFSGGRWSTDRTMYRVRDQLSDPALEAGLTVKPYIEINVYIGNSKVVAAGVRITASLPLELSYTRSSTATCWKMTIRAQIEIGVAFEAFDGKIDASLTLASADVWGPRTLLDRCTSAPAPTGAVPAPVVAPSATPTFNPPPSTSSGGTVSINGRFGACSFGSSCLIAGFTASGFNPPATVYTCIFGDGSRYNFSFGGGSVGTACYTNDRPDSITVEVRGVRSGTVTTSAAAPTPPPVVTPPPVINPPPTVQTWPETVGGNSHTWTNYLNAGGTEGPLIPAFTTVQIACKIPGFRVADGNTWWYRIASSPWNNNFYVSADAFYNNGATSGSLVGTPFVDPAVRDC